MTTLDSALTLAGALGSEVDRAELLRVRADSRLKLEDVAGAAADFTEAIACGQRAGAPELAAAEPPRVDIELRRLTGPVTDRVVALSGLVRGLATAGIEVEDLGVRRPTLDEAFLRLTGRERAAAEREVAA